MCLEGAMNANLEYPFWLFRKRINKKLPLTVLPLLKTRFMSFLPDNLYFLGSATRDMSKFRYVEISKYQTVSRFLLFLLLLAKTSLPNLVPDLVRKPCFLFLFFFFGRYSVDFIPVYQPRITPDGLYGATLPDYIITHINPAIGSGVRRTESRYSSAKLNLYGVVLLGMRVSLSDTFLKIKSH